MFAIIGAAAIKGWQYSKLKGQYDIIMRQGEIWIYRLNHLKQSHDELLEHFKSTGNGKEDLNALRREAVARGLVDYRGCVMVPQWWELVVKNGVESEMWQVQVKFGSRMLDFETGDSITDPVNPMTGQTISSEFQAMFERHAAELERNPEALEEILADIEAERVQRHSDCDERSKALDDELKSLCREALGQTDPVETAQSNPGMGFQPTQSYLVTDTRKGIRRQSPADSARGFGLL